MVEFPGCAARVRADAVVAAAARRGCGGRAGVGEAIVASFAKQFSIDVSAIGDERRSRLSAALGNNVFRAVVLMYIADFIPRVRAGLEALGVGQEYLERCTTTSNGFRVLGCLPSVRKRRCDMWMR
jgi:hypothetical protein